jgi:hypothetical protein
MDALLELITNGYEQLLGRAGGPLHFRLVFMPTMVTILAIRAGLRDAREGHPAFPGGVFTNPGDRRRILRSGLRDIGKIIVFAIVLDTTYQLFVLRWFYPGQLLIVVVACTIVPYLLIRGPVTHLARALGRHRATGEQD